MQWQQTNEVIAAWIVSERVGGSPIRHDDGSNNGQFDYLVVSESGKIGLEVTRCIDRRLREALRAQPPELPSAKGAWEAAIAHETRVKSLSFLDEVVSHLEGAGQTHHRPTKEDDPYQLLKRHVHELHQRKGAPGKLTVRPATMSWFSTPNDLNILVSREVGNNSDKLSDPDLFERHLFIWVDFDTSEASWALHMGHLPTEEPLIATPVDSVWVCAIWGTNPLARWNRNIGWQLLPDANAFGNTAWHKYI